MAMSNRGLAVAAVLLGASGLVLVGCGQATVDPAQEQARAPGVQMSIAQIDVDPCANPTDPACTPTGAHAKHTSVCSVCHFVAGRLAFDPNGPAYASWTPGQPRPAFNATTKTCSNVACHGVPAGTFSYYFPGGDGEPVLNTVNYGGPATQVTPAWNSTGTTCSGCHPNPPRNGSDGSNVWHSGYHGGQGPTGAYNQCQFCHPDATGSNGAGTAITNPTLHGNGTANVQARFTSACFGCH
jgi:hypothetical protein